MRKKSIGYCRQKRESLIIRNYIWNEWNMAFSRYGSLQRHEVIHTKNYKYVW